MLSHLRLSNFRNHAATDLAFSPRMNLVTGANGSGKTTLLEAVYFVGSGGRSFRGGRLSRLVRDGCEAATIFAEIRQGDARHRVGVRRVASGIESLKLDGATPAALSDVASLLPVLALHPQSVELVLGSARGRRRFLDWGMFHVEHAFLGNWRVGMQALRQRNALLRHGEPSARQLRYWDQQFAQVSDTINRMRSDYIARLRVRLRTVLSQLAPDLDGTIALQSGLRPGEACQQALDRHRAEDLRRGFTHSGFHRADLKISLNGRVARDRVSRGQAKILAYALLLAQLPLIEEAGKRCTLLIDDLASELDAAHRGRLVELLTGGVHQTFITALQADSVGDVAGKGDGNTVRMFHVEQGCTRQISHHH